MLNLYVGFMGPSVVVSCYCGWSVRHDWLPVQLVSRFCLFWRLPTTGWWGWVTGWLAAEPWGEAGVQEILWLVATHCCMKLGLVSTHWQEKLGPGI